MAKKKPSGKKPSSKKAADARDFFPPDFSPNGAFEILRMLSEKTGMDPLEVMSRVMGGQMPGGDRDVFQIPATHGKKLKAGSVEDLLQQASMADDVAKSLLLLQKAIEKGEKELKRELRDNVGEFGDIPKAQAYLMARNELTGCLLELEKFDDAIQNMKELLRLDQRDVLRVRWLLLESYCRLNQIENAQALIQQFPEDDSALFSVTRLCLDFQKIGRTEQLDAKLLAALEENTYLVEDLLNGDPADFGKIDAFAIGSAEEAIVYGRKFRSLWKSTPGALAWLKQIAKQVSDDRDVPESDVELFAADGIEDAKDLKKGKEVWFLDIDVLDPHGNSMPGPIEWDNESPPDDWIMSVINAENQDLVRIEPGEFSLTPAGAIVEMCTTMLEPNMGKPRRPKMIQCVKGLLCPELRDALKQLKITLEEVDETPEIIQFLRRQRPNDVPGEFPLDQILELPVTGDVIWEIDWRPIDAWIHDPETGEATQPWITLVCSPEEGTVRAQHVTQTIPNKKTIAATLAKAILEPLQGTPARPCGLIVRQLSYRIDIEETAASIDCGVVVEVTRMTDHVIQSMEDHRTESTVHQFEPLMRAEHMTPQVLEDLFNASAEYLRSRIYTRVRAESAVEIVCPEICKTPLYAVVMGQNGQEIGVMIFFNFKSAQGMIRSRSNDFESLAKKMTGIGYSIGPKEQLHPLDVAAADQFGWPVPDPDAWPSLYHIEKGEIRSLTTAQVRLTTISIIATMKAHQQSTTSATQDIALSDRVMQVSTKKISL